MLALSGATAMFHSLIDALLPSLAASQEHSAKVLSDAEKRAASLLIDALVQPDIRGHSPISYLLMRYGEVGAVGRLLEKIKRVFVAADASLSVFTLPYSTYRHTTPAAGVAAAAEAAKAAATRDTGGWDTDKLPTALLYFPQYNSSSTAAGSSDHSETAYAAARKQAQSADRCDILEHYGPMPSAEEFYRVYVSTGTPVIFRGAALGSTIRQNLQKKTFLKEFGKESVVISNLPYAGTVGVCFCIGVYLLLLLDCSDEDIYVFVSGP